MRNEAEAGDRFGSVLEAGDFNGDDRPDLAVGVPQEDHAAVKRAGGVAVMLSGASGLSDIGNRFWHEASSGVLGVVEAGDRFGYDLAAGDFNADGRDDLAIGIPFQDVTGKSAAGDVAILHGGINGLRTADDQRWNEDSPGIKGRANVRDHLGWALRALDADNDGDADLAIGIPDQNIAGHSNAGALLLLKGRSGGITAVGDSYWHQDTVGVREVAAPGDKFAKAL